MAVYYNPDRQHEQADLPQYLRDMITKLIAQETNDFLRRHNHYPAGREHEDVVDNVFSHLESLGIKIPYVTVDDHYYQWTNSLIS